MPLPMALNEIVTPPPEVIHEMIVDHVVDGDTITGRVVLSDTSHDALGITVTQTAVYNGRVRLLSVNAPEMSTAEGKTVKAWVQERIKPGDIVQTRAPRDVTDQYGRMIADIWFVPFNPDQTIPIPPVSLSAELLATDSAVPMTGKKLERLAPQLPSNEAADFVAHVPALVRSARASRPQ